MIVCEDDNNNNNRKMKLKQRGQEAQIGDEIC